MPHLGLHTAGNSFNLRTQSSAGTESGEAALLHGPASHMDMDRGLNGRASDDEPFESSAMKEVCCSLSGLRLTMLHTALYSGLLGVCRHNTHVPL